MKLPPIPRSVPGILGPIEVVRSKHIEYEGVVCNGLWESDTRTITISLGLSLAKAHHVLWHERTHADLHESNSCIPDDLEEIVCEGIATARVAEMLSSHPKARR